MEANRKSRIHMRDPNVREINMKAKEKKILLSKREMRIDTSQTYL
jgi:hypothetical protein